MDCEGAEYDLLLNVDGETLRHFDELFVEFHYGLDGLSQALAKAGFEVKPIGKPDYLYSPRNKNPYFQKGMLLARKI